MKNIKYLILFTSILCASCHKFLDQTPQGVVSGVDLNTPENVDKMVIAHIQN